MILHRSRRCEGTHFVINVEIDRHERRAPRRRRPIKDEIILGLILKVVGYGDEETTLEQ